MGYQLQAKDDETGSIEDFYFERRIMDDQISGGDHRHMARRASALISPISLGTLNSNAKTVEVNLTPSVVITKHGFTSTTAGKATGPIDRLESSWWDRRC